MNIGTSLKTISKNQLCSFVGTGGYVELAETDVLSDGSIVTAAAMLPLLNSRNDKGEGILPPGYQRVEFLESSGTQYILTDLIPDNNWRFEAIFYPMGEPDAGTIFGQDNENGVGAKAGFVYKAMLRYGGFADIGSARISLRSVYAQKNTVIYSGNTLKNTLTGAQATVPQSSWTGLYRIAIYANHRVGVIIEKTSARICQLRFWDEVSHMEYANLIPALDTDGTPCMFDTVTKQPFYNAGTGSFRVGISTLQQVRELQLPDNTGNAVRTLYVSLPQEARTDFTAQKHLSYLTDSLNWSINVQYRDGDIPADYTKVDFLESTGAQNIVVQSPELRYSRLTWNQEVDIQFLSDVKSLVGFKGRTGLYWGRFEDKHVGVGTGAMSPAPVTGREKLIFTTRCFTSESTNPEAPYGEWRSTLAAADGSWDTWHNNLPGADIGQDPLFGLFRYGDDEGNLAYNPGSIRIWSCKCWCDSVSYDLVPVLDENGVPGMWDKVGKKFLDNSGTGAFIVGIKTLNDARMLNNMLPDVTAESPDSITLSLPVEASTDAPAQKALKDLADRGWSITVQYREDEIPAGYAKVAFLASSGSQYIDTGIATDGNFTISCRLQVSSAGAVWGRACTPPYDEYTGGQSWARFLSPSDSNRGLWFYYNYVGSAFSNNASRPPMWDISKPHDWVAVEGEKTVMLDGESVTLGNQFNYVVNVTNPDQRTHYIFATNGEYIYGTGKAPMKLYRFTMIDGDDKTVLDLIPVINTDGVPGMYDKVSKKFFENDGTGQFRVGLASKEAVCNLYLTPDVQEGTTINLSVPAGTTTEDTNTLKANNPNYTFNIQYRS